MYLQQHLRNCFPAPVRERGAALYASGCVSRLSGNQWKAAAVVRGSFLYEVNLSRDGDGMQANCACPYFESEGLCKHIWAVILAADSKNYLLGRVGSRPPRMIQEARADEDLTEDFVPYTSDDEEDFDETPPNRRVYQFPSADPARKPQPKWRAALAALKLARTVPARAPDWKQDHEIYYVIDAPRTMTNGTIILEVLCRDRLKTGAWGKLKGQGIERAAIPHIPDERDREILLTLCGAPDAYYYYAASRSYVYQLPAPLSGLLLPKVCYTGRCCVRAEAGSTLDNMTRLSWDEGPAWQFRLRVDASGKQWVIRGSLHRGQEMMDLAEPALLLSEGLLFARGQVARLDHGASFPWIALLRASAQIEVPVAHGSDLVVEMLSQPSLPPVDWPEELRFEEVTDTPRLCLTLRKPTYTWRRQDYLCATLSFDYGGTTIPESQAGPGIYEPGRRRFWRRDNGAEQRAAQRLLQLGVKRSSGGYPGEDHPGWECSSKKVPKVIRELLCEGWHIESEGKLFRKAAGFRAELTSGIDWFELRGGVDFGAGSEQIELPDLLRALERDEDLVRLSDGSYGMLPDEIREKYGLLVRLGRKQGDHLRFSRAQAGILDLLLAGREEVRVDELFQRARAELRQFERIAPAAQPSGFVGRLRGYQLEGLAWMHFLRQFGFGGCLADDMGVGKTAQVLALLETRRALPDGEENGRAGHPRAASLAVVPRSLVYNWKREAERFTPRLRVLDHTGAGRQKNTGAFDQYDLILTTYGTLRRDAAEFQAAHFDYIILDEAQAIKNAVSESAKAARLLRGDHRLALSGTPVENHLGELWSLFEFLNPGMLGAAQVFQMAGDTLRKPDEETRQVLAKAVRPFILRRTKDQVACELPSKIEQTLYCELDDAAAKTL